MADTSKQIHCSHRRFGRHVTVALVMIFAATSHAQGPRAQGPNVLFISVDDLNDWIGPLGGHPQTKTPNLDGLAGRGVTFTRAYCQAPSCNPSRTSLMTGIRPSTSGVYGNADVWRRALPDAVTLPQHFILHGYEVLGGGKTFHGPQNEAASWQAYFQFTGFLHPPNKPANGIPKTGHFDWGGLSAQTSETADARLAAWAERYLSRKHSRPFFLAVGFYRPHLPWYAPQEHFKLFPPERTELPSTLAGDIDDIPQSALRNFRDHGRVTSHGEWRRAVASYLACINYADANVGRVLRALDSGPHANNTIIVLWSDHGWQLGEKKQWRKFTLWERSARVVMMLAGPAIPARNRKSGRTVELLDIYPTLIDLCGLPKRHEIEGRSLRPLLENPDAPWDKPAITSLSPDKVTVRTERWRYSRYLDGEELYDHASDPMEWHNLADRPEHAETIRFLSGLLPEDPSPRQPTKLPDLPASERRLVDIPDGRFRKSDPSNYVALKESLE
jgi:arylsulfatase A-like enzyme